MSGCPMQLEGNTRASSREMRNLRLGTNEQHWSMMEKTGYSNGREGSYEALEVQEQESRCP